jgi:Lar family restriction alleviation protein
MTAKHVPDTNMSPKPIENDTAISRPGVCPQPLRPCPFCGGSDLRINRDIDPKFVACNKCWAFGPTAPTVALATERWNKRPAMPPEAMDPPRANLTEL